MDVKKLLVLGSDYSTEQVVIEAQSLGIHVIVTDLMKTSPAKRQADEVWYISTTDIDALEKKCRESGVGAVMFGASDFNINNARALCKKLGLPIYCDGDLAWSVARNKGLFKEWASKVGAPVAKDYLITDIESEEQIRDIIYPVVVKPVDKSGNRGMSFCNNREELVSAYKLAQEVSDNPRIIVERQLCGEEYNIHYVLANGEARLLYLNGTYHQPEYPANLYSFKCTTSNHLPQYINEVNDSAIALLKAVGCREGIAWFDAIRDKDGKFYLLEMGYRFGGVMTYRPYENAYGFNTIRHMLEVALGKKHTADDLPEPLMTFVPGCAGSYHLFALRDGTIDKIVGLDKISKIPGVWVDMPKREGDSIRAFANSGLIGIYGNTVDDLCEKLAMINSTLQVLDKDGNSLIIKYDDCKTLKEAYENGRTLCGGIL